jgi:spermidine/putrescine transport system ATP-binding protein
LYAGSPAKIYVRPEALGLAAQTDTNKLLAQMERLEFEGAYAIVHAKATTGQKHMSLQMAVPSIQLDQAPVMGRAEMLSFAPRHAVVLADG